MEFTPAHDYLSKKNCKFLSSFYNKRSIKQTLNNDMIGNKYYIVFEEYNDKEQFDFTIRPATLVDIQKNFNTGNKEFIFNYENAVFTYPKNKKNIPMFAYRIVEGNSNYLLYNYDDNEVYY